MKIKKENIKVILFGATFFLIGIIYPLINKPGIKVHSLVTDLDNSIPLIKIFVIPYIAWYAYVALSLIYFYKRDKKAFLKVIAMLDICLIVAFSTFTIYQTTVPRPILTGSDVFTKLIGFVYNTDRPFNCFPSVHVIETYIIMRAVSKMKDKSRSVNLLIQAIGILIILSTLFIKQHVILDVVYAILLVRTISIPIYGYKGSNIIQWARNILSLLTMKKKLEI